jgi:hypothetical protein
MKITLGDLLKRHNAILKANKEIVVQDDAIIEAPSTTSLLKQAKLLLLDKSVEVLIKDNKPTKAQYDRIIQAILDQKSSNSPLFETHAAGLLCMVLNKAMAQYQKEDDPAAKKELGDAIFTYQRLIADKRDENFLITLKLPQPLDLSVVKDSYMALQPKTDTVFGKFKAFFRQSSRSADLDFLANIEKHCAVNENKYSMEEINNIKLTATNMVLERIDKETYGKNSKLKEVLEGQIASAGLDNKGGVRVFKDKIKDTGVMFPEGLEEILENKLEEKKQKIEEVQLRR